MQSGIAADVSAGGLKSTAHISLREMQSSALILLLLFYFDIGNACGIAVKLVGWYIR